MFTTRPFGHMKLFNGFDSEAEIWHERIHNIQSKMSLFKNDHSISSEEWIKNTPKGENTKTYKSSNSKLSFDIWSQKLIIGMDWTKNVEE